MITLCNFCNNYDLQYVKMSTFEWYTEPYKSQWKCTQGDSNPGSQKS